MKTLDRDKSLIPNKLLDRKEKEHYYNNLRDSSGKIKDRWNTIQEKEEKIVRMRLLSISLNACCYCGKKVQGSDLDVDHFLPSFEFPYLAYCWENMLPSCKRCNQALKNDYCPPSLKGKKIIEHCGQNLVTPFDLTYNKNIIYNIANDERLIDPTFDDVKNHLEFNPEFFFYKAKSDIGKKTIEIFFDNIETMKFFEQISTIVKGFVDIGLNRSVLDPIIETYGSEYYYNIFWEFWTKEKEEGRLINNSIKVI